MVCIRAIIPGARCPSCKCPSGSVEEEPQHFSARIGAPRVGVRPTRAATRPRVRRAVDHPVLAGRAPRVVDEHRARGRPAPRGVVDAVLPRRHARDGLGHRVAVAVVHGGVGVSVEHDARHAKAWGSTLEACGRPALHRAQRRRQVARHTGRQPRVHADRRHDIGAGLRQHRRHRAACREPGHEHPRAIEPMLGHHGADERFEQCRLAAPARLVLVLEPVPAPLGVHARRLRRVQHAAAACAGHVVHARAGGEVFRRLRAAMQHDDERRTGHEARRQEQPVVAAQARRGMAAAQELARLALRVAAGPRGRGGIRRCRGHGGRKRPVGVVKLAGDHVDDVGVARVVGWHPSVLRPKRRLDERGGAVQVAGSRQRGRAVHQVSHGEGHGGSWRWRGEGGGVLKAATPCVWPAPP